MFSKTVEYALRAMVHLVEYDLSGQGGQTVEQIAARTGVPVAYLSKVLQALARGNLIISQRGMGGGFRLAHAAREITILAVVNAVDPILRIETCPLGLEAHGANLCPLHRKMDDAMAFVEAQFADTTLAELVGGLDVATSPGTLCAPGSN